MNRPTVPCNPAEDEGSGKAGPPRVAASVLVLCLLKWAVVNRNLSDGVWWSLPAPKPRTRMRTRTRTRRQPGVYTRHASSSLIGHQRETRGHARPHKSRSSYLHVFLYPSSRTKRTGGGGVGGGRLNGKLEGPGESRGETHKHFRAMEESAVSGSGVEAGENAALLPSL